MSSESFRRDEKFYRGDRFQGAREMERNGEGCKGSNRWGSANLQKSPQKPLVLS